MMLSVISQGSFFSHKILSTPSLVYPTPILASNLEMGLCPGGKGSGLIRNLFLYHDTQIRASN